MNGHGRPETRGAQTAPAALLALALLVGFTLAGNGSATRGRDDRRTVESVATSGPSAQAAEAISTQGRRRIPILMYHVVGDPPSGAPFPDLYVRTSDLVAQLTWLERHDFAAVTLQEVWRHWHSGTTLPARSIVVSFDDGYRSTAEVALPALRGHGWPGVLNLKVRSLEVT